MDRSTSPIFAAAKGAWNIAVEWLGGHAVAVNALGVHGTYVSRYGQAHESCVVPIDIAWRADRALLAQSRKPVILAIYADLLGFDIVPKGEGARADLADLDERAGAAMQENGEALVAVAAFRKRASPRNAAEAVREAEEAKEAWSHVVDRLRPVAAQAVRVVA